MSFTKTSENLGNHSEGQTWIWFFLKFAWWLPATHKDKAQILSTTFPDLFLAILSSNTFNLAPFPTVLHIFILLWHWAFSPSPCCTIKNPYHSFIQPTDTKSLECGKNYSNHWGYNGKENRISPRICQSFREQLVVAEE